LKDTRFIIRECHAKIVANTCLGFCAAAMLIGTVAQGEMRINEVVASNRSMNADEDGDFSDWIGLVNSGPDSVSLDGWGYRMTPTRRFVGHPLL